jgi:hypothetical protein
MIDAVVAAVVAAVVGSVGWLIRRVTENTADIERLEAIQKHEREKRDQQYADLLAAVQETNRLLIELLRERRQ